MEEQLEAAQNSIRETIAVEVASAIKGAVVAMQQALVTRFVTSFDEISKQQDDKLAAAISRLEGRITRSRDTQESLISTMREDQLQFQSDVRSTLTTLKSNKSKQLESHNEQLDSGFVVGEGSTSAVRKGGGFFVGIGGSGGVGSGPGGGSGHEGGAGSGSGGGPGYFGSNGAPSGGGRNQWRHKKLDMPLFDGTNPDGWILRAERFFNFYGLAEEEKVEATVVALEGQALLWFQWEHRRRPIERWEQVKTLLRRQFRSQSAGTLQEQWLAHRQGGTVMDYRLRFIELLAPLENVSEELSLGQFLNGLREDIRAEVRILGPLTVDHAMELAHMVEDKLNVGKQKWENKLALNPLVKPNNYMGQSTLSPRSYNSPSLKSYSNYSPSGISTGSSPLPVTKPMGELRRLSEKELQDKRAKGLCFRCDGKWSIGHKCQRKELSVLLTQEDESTEEDLGSAESRGDEENGQEEELHPEISLNSVVGITSPKTFKLRGEVNGKPVVVMIDPGATHNFISLRAVEELRVNYSPSKHFGVSLGTGETVQSTGECKSVVLQLQGITIIEDFLPIALGNSDLILGLQWLEKLGTMSANWNSQKIKFKLGNDMVTLTGDASLGRTGITLKAMMKTLRNEGKGFLVEFNYLGAVTEKEQEIQKASEVPSFLSPLVQHYQGVFDLPSGLPPVRHQDHNIVLKEGTDPVNVRPYRYPQIQNDEIERLIHDMLAAGIIQLSHSPFSSPVLLVKKKDGSWRFCVDYRALNKATIPNKFPIPVIDELLDELHGAAIFTKLDLKFGYHQVRVRSEDVPKTAFRTHEGHYEFLVMPFGLTNAPATFQAIMNEVFRPFLRKFVLVFFDDILVYSATAEEHVQHVKAILKTLNHHQLYANRKKCEFGKTEVAYLDHLISQRGVVVDPSKVQAMWEWPTPRNIKDLRGFLGLSGYYRKFIKNYAHIALPLTELLKKDCFGWTERATTAFEALKQALMSAPVLNMPDFKILFTLETDASDFGLGAVLLQNEHPIAYFSKILGRRARLKSIYEKELMAIVLAVQKWRHYLLGHTFVIRTDQQSLKFLMEQREVGMEYQRWVSKLLGYHFQIVYKPGATNKVADALSRVSSENIELGTIISIAGVGWEEVQNSIQGDDFIQRLGEDLAANKPHPRGYELVQDIVRYKGRIVIPPKSNLVTTLLREYHDSPIGGHSGEFKTYQRLAKEWYWVGMRKAVSKYISECVTCQQQKHSSLMPAGFLQPLPVPTRIWEDISLDFVERLPKSQGMDTLLVVVDRLSKYAHFIGLSHPFTAHTVAHIFVKEVVRLHGYPSTIVSDRDRIFMSLFWKELFRGTGGFIITIESNSLPSSNIWSNRGG